MLRFVKAIFMPANAFATASTIVGIRLIPATVVHFFVVFQCKVACGTDGPIELIVVAVLYSHVLSIACVRVVEVQLHRVVMHGTGRVYTLEKLDADRNAGPSAVILARRDLRAKHLVARVALILGDSTDRIIH
jgi:hypothetical protein